MDAPIQILKSNLLMIEVKGGQYLCDLLGCKPKGNGKDKAEALSSNSHMMLPSGHGAHNSSTITTQVTAFLPTNQQTF
jgi:hypothetical protein